MAQRGPARSLGGPWAPHEAKLGLQVAPPPKRMESSFTSRLHYPSGRAWAPWGPPPQLGLCCSQSYSKRTFPHRRHGLGRLRAARVPRWWGLGLPSCFSGFPVRRVPLPHPCGRCTRRKPNSEPRTRLSTQAQHLACGARGRPSVLGSSVLFTTPGRSRANTAFPPHGPVTSSPCLNSRWANRWR